MSDLRNELDAADSDIDEVGHKVIAALDELREKRGRNVVSYTQNLVAKTMLTYFVFTTYCGEAKKSPNEFGTHFDSLKKMLLNIVGASLTSAQRQVPGGDIDDVFTLTIEGGPGTTVKMVFDATDPEGRVID